MLSQASHWYPWGAAWRAYHNSVTPLEVNLAAMDSCGEYVAFDRVRQRSQNFWSQEYVRVSPPWTNDTSCLSSSVGQADDDCLEQHSLLTTSSSLHSRPDSPAFSATPPEPRPLLRRFDPGEVRPSDVGQPSPPQSVGEFIKRRKQNRRPRSRGKFCVVCKENGDEPEKYRSHNVKNSEGVVVCPAMRSYNCPECQNGGGDRAHSVTHCPLRRARIFDQLVQQGLARSRARPLDGPAAAATGACGRTV
ncbi:nanos1-like [Tropilaelaps mercedesae]|uniref:Nanos1-like n=1 Tax=Tropilaelaps mercedesae TaxID=418985 RepID=A0A1V9X0K4_9ACAR|nr:nanos1-like [Tropilaelaps mercedesae]